MLVLERELLLTKVCNVLPGLANQLIELFPSLLSPLESLTGVKFITTSCLLIAVYCN